MAAVPALLALRLAGQRISAPATGDVSTTLRHLLAVQAQDPAAAPWALGLRTAATGEADVERAIAERRIVRSWPMRGTLHLVAAGDLRWMLSLLASRISALDSKRIARDHGLDERALGQCRDVVSDLLRGGRVLSRPALYAALDARGIDVAGPRGLQILGRLAHDGLICQGPREGRQPTFVLLDDWLPPQPARDRDDALAELARRYLIGHGPASVRDLAWWSGLTLRDAQVAWDLVRSEFASLRVDGTEYRYVESGVPVARAGVHLLPAFDEYLVGYQDRSAMIAGADLRRVIGANGLFQPTVVSAGRVVATWKRELRKDHVAIQCTPLRTLGAGERKEITRAAKAYGRFLGRPVQLHG